MTIETRETSSFAGRTPDGTRAGRYSMQAAHEQLIGTPKQVSWARRIQGEMRKRWQGKPLPGTPFASFWITHRAASYEALWEAGESPIGQLHHSPFSADYPRYGYDDACTTLALLAESPDYLVMDTETTGIGKAHEVTEIAIVNRHEEVILHTRIRPDEAALESYLGSTAEKLTGITADALTCAPTFADVYHDVMNLLTSGVPLLAYNAAFDAPMIRRTARKYGIAVPPLSVVCAMKLFSAFMEADDNFKLGEACEMAGIALYRETNERQGHGKHMEDTPVAHTAAGDALVTVRLIEWMIHHIQQREQIARREQTST